LTMKAVVPISARVCSSDMRTRNKKTKAGDV